MLAEMTKKLKKNDRHRLLMDTGRWFSWLIFSNTLFLYKLVLNKCALLLNPVLLRPGDERVGPFVAWMDVVVVVVELTQGNHSSVLQGILILKVENVDAEYWEAKHSVAICKNCHICNTCYFCKNFNTCTCKIFGLYCIRNLKTLKTLKTQSEIPSSGISHSANPFHTLGVSTAIWINLDKNEMVNFNLNFNFGRIIIIKDVLVDLCCVGFIVCFCTCIKGEHKVNIAHYHYNYNFELWNCTKKKRDRCIDVVIATTYQMLYMIYIIIEHRNV